MWITFVTGSPHTSVILSVLKSIQIETYSMLPSISFFVDDKEIRCRECNPFVVCLQNFHIVNEVNLDPKTFL